MNETAFNTSRFNQSALNASMLSGAGARRASARAACPPTPTGKRWRHFCFRHESVNPGKNREKSIKR